MNKKAFCLQMTLKINNFIAQTMIRFRQKPVVVYRVIIKKYCQEHGAHLQAYLCNGTFGKRERGLP